ncbi:hypothetical protein, partial [Pseudomonas aeruginosa]|uniref:hypothetical protein n=1 Tax=Pseudomonas aeruginosa TaxID=287 RepID=UPI0029C03FEB
MQKATLEGAPFRGANNATGVIRRDPATTADNRKRLFALGPRATLEGHPGGGCSAVAVLARIWKINDAVEMAPEDAQPIEYQRKLTRRGLGFTQ